MRNEEANNKIGWTITESFIWLNSVSLFMPENKRVKSIIRTKLCIPPVSNYFLCVYLEYLFCHWHNQFKQHHNQSTSSLLLIFCSIETIFLTKTHVHRQFNEEKRCPFALKGIIHVWVLDCIIMVHTPFLMPLISIDLKKDIEIVKTHLEFSLRLKDNWIKSLSKCTPSFLKEGGR